MQFQHTVGKTLKGRKVNEFVVPKIDDSFLCPVLAFQLYVEGSKSIGIYLLKRYLFQTLDVSKSIVTEDPASSSTLFSRSKY